MKCAFIFPGQGSQLIGMGQNVYHNFSVAKATLEESCDALHFDLAKLMFEGPLETLTMTENTQPALLAASLMIVRVLESEVKKPLRDLGIVCAGHSLGEYSALCASQSLSLPDAMKSVRFRGQAMQNTVPPGVGAMAAILGLEVERIDALLKEIETKDQVCVVANDNSPGQTVISGHIDAVHNAIDYCMQHGAKKRIILPVSAPFHSPLMQSAADKMTNFLQEINFFMPSMPLVMNITASLLETEQSIKPLLTAQICGRVRWTQSILKMREMGVDAFFELGSGKVLSGLIKRTVSDVEAHAIQDADSIDLFLKRMA